MTNLTKNATKTSTEAAKNRRTVWRYSIEKKNATLSDADVSKYLDQDISGYEKQWKNKL